MLVGIARRRHGYCVATRGLPLRVQVRVPGGAVLPSSAFKRPPRNGCQASDEYISRRVRAGSSRE
jgi:hypothetical protein